MTMKMKDISLFLRALRAFVVQKLLLPLFYTRFRPPPPSDLRTFFVFTGELFVIEDLDFFANGQRIAEAAGETWNPERRFRLQSDHGEQREFTTLAEIYGQIDEIERQRRTKHARRHT